MTRQQQLLLTVISRAPSTRARIATTLRLVEDKEAAISQALDQSNRYRESLKHVSGVLSPALTASAGDETMQKLKSALETCKAVRRFQAQRLKHLSFGSTRLFRALAMLDFEASCRSLEKRACGLRSEMAELNQFLNM